MPYKIEIVEEELCGVPVISSVRNATEEEIENAKKLYAENKCDHSLIEDIPGWLYDTRVCALCRKHLGMI